MQWREMYIILCKKEISLFFTDLKQFFYISVFSFAIFVNILTFFILMR